MSTKTIRGMTHAIVIALAFDTHCIASDHADPIDPFNRERLEGGITDLFVFPVLKNDQPAHPYDGNQTIPLHFDPADLARTPLTAEQQQDIDAIVIILCVRRALASGDAVNLAPYTYRVQLDWDADVTFPQDDSEEDLKRARGEGSTGYAMDDDHEHSDATHAHDTTNPARPTPQEAFLRYGGQILRPDKIDEDLTIECRLRNDGTLHDGFPKYIDSANGREHSEWQAKVAKHAGVHDDPFIFPAFFGTNIIAMAIRIPVELLPSRDVNLLVWATSHKGDRQVDHVGRSLRTQNPRFELLNTAHPNQHARLIKDEHVDPSLMRDLANRFNLSSIFAYRKWDQVPDVLIYTTKYPVGFPNGRLLTDDVAALLAQHGDTLLYELSHQHQKGSWPRETSNDVDSGKFNEKFPYLLAQREDAKSPAPLRLSDKNRGILVAIFVAVVALFIVENWIVAKLYHRFKNRRRYL